MTRVRQDLTTGSWRVEQKKMIFIGRLDWVVVKDGFKTKEHAKSFINKEGLI